MNLFELEAVLRLNRDEYTKGINDAEKEGTTFIQKIGNTWTSVKSKYQTVSTVLKPVTDLIGDVVDKYSDFQQMTGGLRQVFGSTADSIIARSKQAYKTAGLSMNNYMDMVISTGAKLLNDLGHDTQAAADMSDKAIIQMADNVNAFGTSWESVSNAYSGFSRGIFTMLDNLKLGFGGTNAEMERLLEMASNISVSDIIKENLNPSDFSSFVGKSVDDFEKAYTQYQELYGKAQEFADENGMQFGDEGFAGYMSQNFAGFMAENFGLDPKDMSVLQMMASSYEAMAEAAREIAKAQGIDVEFDIESYADMIDAIGIVQENLGIAGTTAREAANTISGSKASMSALWDNLKTLMGDPNATKAEIDAASKEFAGAIGKYVENITPTIIAVLRSLLEAGKDLFPEIARVIGEMLPPWLQSGLELIGKVISGIFGIVQAIASHLEALPRGMGISRAAYIAEFGWQQGNEYFEEKEKISGKSGALGDITPEEYREILAAAAVVGSSFRTEEEAAENAKNFNEFVAQEAANKIAESTDKTNENLDILNKTLSEVMATQAKERGLIAPPEQYVRQNDDGTYSKVMVTVDGDVEMEHYQDLNSAIASLVKTITTMGGLDSLPLQYRPQTQVVDNSPNHAKGLWDVPYDDYYARLHRGEMVLTASEARDYREGNGGLSSAVVAAIEGMRNDLQNLQIVVGKKVFGQTVVDYSGKRMSGYIGKSEDKTVAGYGWG